MSALVTQGQLGALPSVFAGHTHDDDLGAGISAGFAVMSYRGKVWRLKHKGEERDLTMKLESGEEIPRPSIEVVLVKSASHLSKNYYESGYTEGSSEAPDCFSVDGVKPDPSSPKLQNPVCASCPKNAFGSKITENGKKAKACADSKRLAVVPLGDIDNESFGGPMLLRIPAASLADLSTYANQLKQAQYPYFAVATRISFDMKEAYPKLIFKPIRVLTNDEAVKIAALQSDDRVQRILETAAVEASEKQAPAPIAFEQAPDENSVQPDAQAATEATGTISQRAQATITKPADGGAPARAKVAVKRAAPAAAPAEKKSEPVAAAPQPVKNAEADGEQLDIEDAIGDEGDGAPSGFQDDLDKELANLNI